MPFNPHVFRQYDIRGVADRDLEDAFARDLGYALGTFWRRAGKRRVAIGQDCRLSSPRLRDALVEGLVGTGCQVTDIGVGPTPLLYFAVFHKELEGGVHVTGSHNPPDENGFKMMVGQGSLYGEDIQVLRKLIEARDFDKAEGGEVTEIDLNEAYVGFMEGNLHFEGEVPPFAVDAGNGAGGPLMQAVCDALKLPLRGMLMEMDGTFPVHHPDPTDPATLEMLRKKVADENLAFGVAFDGDADRIGVIDAEGNVLWGDRLTALFARQVLQTHPGSTVLGEVKCSQVLFDDVEAHGGKAEMSPTGHSLIKAQMKRSGAILAGEMSGHMFFADKYFGFDDALYAALRLAEVVANTGQSVSELIADLPKLHATPELRVPCDDARKVDVVRAVTVHFAERYPVNQLDGVRIRFAEGWGLVRASNTQPVLVMRFEASSEAALAAIQGEVEAVVKQHLA